MAKRRGSPQEEQRYWEEAAREWVTTLSKQFGPNYFVIETPNFLLLCDARKSVAENIGGFCERALSRIQEFLPDLTWQHRAGKWVILMFSTDDSYYRYTSYFHSDGEHPMSGGTCLEGEGYVHIAMPVEYEKEYPHTTLAHELTHACFWQLELPRWLDEALAIRMEAIAGQTPARIWDTYYLDQLIQFWNADNIQLFWHGSSWNLPGEFFGFSYGLSEILWRTIELDFRPPTEAIVQFIKEADRMDGGEEACRAAFNLSLSDVVAHFLGNGDWTPNPECWEVEYTPSKY
ncbi:MAG: hypothetical protein AAF585_15065, partial [Verrucomicrobiota bacterium]